MCDIGVQCNIIGHHVERASTPEPESMSESDLPTKLEASFDSEFEGLEEPFPLIPSNPQ